MSLAESLVLLAVAPDRHGLFSLALDELLAAADLGDELLAGGALPDDLPRAIRERAGTTPGARRDRTVGALLASGRLRVELDPRFGVAVERVELRDRAEREALVSALNTGLCHASALPLRLGLLAALASVGGIGGEALAGDAREVAEDVASGAIQLVADPQGAVPALADGLRQELAALV